MSSVRLHLDTDIGGDMDDLCALAMLLRWPDVEITGITTAAEDGGRRAGYVRRVLELAGRTDVPVAAGVDVRSGRFRFAPGYPSDDRYWGGPVAALPGEVDAGVALLRRSAEAGAVLVGVGPWTNFAELEARAPGTLAGARVVLMGGTVFPSRPGYPAWGADQDYNLQLDVPAARAVLAASLPTLVPLERTGETALRRAHLPALRASGPLGELIARQAEATDRDWRTREPLGTMYPGLPDDTVNFLHDPLACAVALGWREHVRVERLPVAWEAPDGWLRGRVDPEGQAADVVTQVDGRAFSETWLRATCGQHR